MTRTDISVVIACHTERRWDSLRRAVASAQAQDPAPAQVIVAVDRNAALASSLRSQVPGIEVIDHQGTPGAGATRNAGAARATAAILVFLDDDVEAEPGWLRELLVPLGDPQVVGTGGRTLPRWEGPRPRWFPDEFGWVVGASYRGLPGAPAVVRNVWSENMAVRHDAFDGVGGFRPGFGKLGLTSLTEDDTDLCIRVAASLPGSRWVYMPDAVVRHEVPMDRATFTYFLRRCYLEGAGKVHMSRLLGEHSDLGMEYEYLLRVIPAGIVRALRENGVVQAGAMILGILAAAAGAGVGIVKGLPEPARELALPD